MEMGIRNIVNSFIPTIEIGNEHKINFRGLSLAFKSLVDLTESVVEGHEVIVAYVKDKGMSIKDVKKFESLLKEKSGKTIIWVFEDLKSSNTKSLIMNELNFIVLNKQLSLPYLYQSIKKEKKQPQIKLKALSPMAIRILIRQVVKEDLNNVLHKDIVEKVKESKTVVGRAISNISLHELVNEDEEGTSKRVKFADRKTIIRYLSENLFSPVESTFYASKIPELPVAGETALERETLLASNEIKTYAVYKRDKFDYMDLICEEEEAQAKIQIWSWNPKMSEFDRVVDPIGLYLSLKYDHDPRVEISLNELLEKYDLEEIKG